MSKLQYDVYRRAQSTDLTVEVTPFLHFRVISRPTASVPKCTAKPAFYILILNLHKPGEFQVLTE